MTKVFSAVSVIALVLILLSGCSGSDSTSKKVSQSGMTNQISKDLGITNSQTEAGIGAMMMLSKEKLSPSDYSKLSKGIPGGGDSYINKATSLGVLPGSVGTSADIIKVLGLVGVGPIQAAKFTGEVMKFTGSLGGSTFGLLSKVF
ncbi:MAG: DUF2780 domain-containing protein [Ignavibacteria bacterium]|nr:DUF2780 domain-containing protein [Ignavibacteria bacterium]